MHECVSRDVIYIYIYIYIYIWVERERQTERERERETETIASDQKRDDRMSASGSLNLRPFYRKDSAFIK